MYRFISSRFSKSRSNIALIFNRGHRTKVRETVVSELFKRRNTKSVPAIKQSKILRIIISILIASFGCSIHVWYISQTYFKYATTTTATIATEIKSELPGITVCMSTKNMFNKTKWVTRFGREKQKDEGLPPESTIGEMDDLGLDMDSIIGDVVALLGFSRQSWYPAWKPMLKTIPGGRDLKCGTMFRFVENGTRYPRGAILRITFKYRWKEYVDNMTSYRVYIHTPNANIIEILFGTYLELKPGHTIQVRYTTVHSVLLPAPYQSNCFNYSNIPGMDTRADCVNACLFSISSKALKSNRWPREMSVELSSSKYNWSALRFDEKNNWPDFPRDLDKCQDVVCPRVDCVQDYFGLNIINDHNDGKGNETSRLIILFPTEPGISYIYNPRVELVEYVCYLGGVFALWFGISVFATGMYVGKLFRNTSCRTGRKANIIA